MMNDVLRAIVHAKVKSGSLRGARGLLAPNLRKRDFVRLRTYECISESV
jgi:hypothetical protein